MESKSPKIVSGTKDRDGEYRNINIYTHIIMRHLTKSNKISHISYKI